MKNVSEISVASVVRILKDAGAERISDDAKKAFADAVEASAEELAKKVIKAAAHSTRWQKDCYYRRHQVRLRINFLQICFNQKTYF